VLAYVSLVLVLHISGKRAFSKLNAFGLALGSCLAIALVSRQALRGEESGMAACG
jgi:uncharacterized membrane protein YcaP (DUF421 family)